MKSSPPWYVMCSSIPCISYKLVLRSRGLVRFRFNILARIHRRWCYVLPSISTWCLSHFNNISFLKDLLIHSGYQNGAISYPIISSSFENWIASLRRDLLINYLVSLRYSSHEKVSSIYLNFQNNELVL